MNLFNEKCIRIEWILERMSTRFLFCVPSEKNENDENPYVDSKHQPPNVVGFAV